MTNYCFGIIDESREETLDIERTILINKPDHLSEDQISFEEYSLPDNAQILTEEVSNKVIDNISSGIIQSLIIDYRIIVQSELVEGTEIFERITSLIPKFPVVLLTNVPEACYRKDFVDADKIYSKHDFFKVDDDYSREKTRNLFNNIEKYNAIRSRLDVSLKEALISLENTGYTQELYQRIVDLERELDGYTPQEMGQAEKVLNIKDIQEIVRLIQEANSLLGETDET